MCGTLRPSDAGKKAVLMGWVNRRRDLGNIIFIDLRDRTGVTQLVFNREVNAAAHERAEELRADRQPEFTQIDLEMSYPQAERVWEVVEGFLMAAFAATGEKIATPFPRMDYDEAIRLYGIDKPDLRLPAFTDIRDCFTGENLQELAINANLPVIAVRTPKVGDLSRKERDDIKPMFHSKGGAKIFEDFKRMGNKYPAA